MASVTPVDGRDYFGLKPSTTDKSKSQLDLDTFLQLLAVQLATQNPLEPMNDRDFFAQMAQLGQVQGMDNLQTSMEVTQASALIGKTVTAVRPMTESGSGYNSLVTGKVETMTVKNGERFLGIKEANGGIVEVKMTAIQQVKS